mmetsp:Transcript_128/g.453  ORF Transcript_128/g.453 Transcript_128/m.453 type:complete len:211 (+) Transcript_128:314-946(+)
MESRAGRTGQDAGQNVRWADGHMHTFGHSRHAMDKTPLEPCLRHRQASQVSFQLHLKVLRDLRRAVPGCVQRVLDHPLHEDARVDLLQLGPQRRRARVNVEYEAQARLRLVEVRAVAGRAHDLRVLAPIGDLPAHLSHDLLEAKKHAKHETRVLAGVLPGERVQRSVPLLVIQACSAPREDVHVEDHGRRRQCRRSRRCCRQNLDWPTRS